MLKTWSIQNLWRLAKLGAWKNVGVHGNVDTAGKLGGPAEELPYCLGSTESATAEFSLVPLISTFSSLLMLNRVHVVSK